MVKATSPVKMLEGVYHTFPFSYLMCISMSPLHRSVVAGQLALVWEILNSDICNETLVNMKVLKAYNSFVNGVYGSL